MRVLVTGSQGYIGSVLAPLLAEAGHDVHGFDTGFYRGCNFGDEVGVVPTIDRDVRDVRAPELEGFDAIVHLAALSNDPLGDLAPNLTEEINFRATLQLAREAREAGVRRFVFASSCSMYGASGGGRCARRGPRRCGRSPRTPSRRSARRRAWWSSPGRTSCPVSMRNATVYGVSPRLRLDIVLNNLAAWSHTTGQDPAAQRRHRLASADPRARRREDGAGDARGSGGRRPRRGLQRRLGGAELCDPRSRRGARRS